jgi:hypothetical protein
VATIMVSTTTVATILVTTVAARRCDFFFVLCFLGENKHFRLARRPRHIESRNRNVLHTNGLGMEREWRGLFYYGPTTARARCAVCRGESSRQEASRKFLNETDGRHENKTDVRKVKRGGCSHFSSGCRRSLIGH